MGGMCLSVCIGEGGSRRRDVGLMRDTLTPLLVRQGGVVVYDERVLLLLLQRRRCAAALGELTGELIGELAKLLRVGQWLQHSVLALQHWVPLVQLLDVLLQHLHLLTNSIHQVALHQVLKYEERENKLIKMSPHSFKRDLFLATSEALKWECRGGRGGFCNYFQGHLPIKLCEQYWDTQNSTWLSGLKVECLEQKTQMLSWTESGSFLSWIITLKYSFYVSETVMSVGQLKTSHYTGM